MAMINYQIKLLNIVPNLYKTFDKSLLTQYINGVTFRFASCQSPGQSQKGKNRKPHNRKLYVNPGEFVSERIVLAKQKNMKYHPGYNVAVDPRDKSLYSLCCGTVFYSIEKFNPDKENQFVEKYCAFYKTGPIYKKYIHVIPDKPKNQFRLIDLV